MRLIDRELPAAQYLVGPDAIDVLRVPIEATGGHIESARPVQVQYRPGSDVIVRYSTRVSWNGEPAVRETLVAASTVHGNHDGAVPVTAVVPGGPLTVGVWRWPFDPVLGGLADAVTPASVAALLGVGRRGLNLEIVAYRPTDRVVVRVARDDTAVAYLKVVAPNRTEDIAARHAALLAAGVPVANVLMADATRGVLVLEALEGPTLRELIKGGDGGWPTPREFARLTESFAAAEVPGNGPVSRLADGPLHARMLAAVLPGLADELEDLARRFESFEPAPIDAVVHGDLHEGQVIVHDGRIVGVLDIDDVGLGASVDDWANLIARFRFRAATTTDRVGDLDADRVGGLDADRVGDLDADRVGDLDADRVGDLKAYADGLRATALERHDAGRLDLHTSAALVGLATGPFRIQSVGWRDTVRAVVSVATELSMRELSA